MFESLWDIMLSYPSYYQNKIVALKHKFYPQNNKLCPLNIKFRHQARSKHARESSRRPEFPFKLPSKQKVSSLKHKFRSPNIKFYPHNKKFRSRSIKVRPRNIKI